MRTNWLVNCENLSMLAQWMYGWWWRRCCRQRFGNNTIDLMRNRCNIIWYFIYRISHPSHRLTALFRAGKWFGMVSFCSHALTIERLEGFKWWLFQCWWCSVFYSNWKFVWGFWIEIVKNCFGFAPKKEICKTKIEIKRVQSNTMTVEVVMTVQMYLQLFFARKHQKNFEQNIDVAKSFWILI